MFARLSLNVQKLFHLIKIDFLCLYLTREHPPHSTNGLHTTVVAGNGNINISRWRISITESNNWNVDIRSLSDGLMIKLWVSYNKQTWFTESLLDLIGESSWSKSSSNWGSTSVGSKLQCSSLDELNKLTDWYIVLATNKPCSF